MQLAKYRWFESNHHSPNVCVVLNCKEEAQRSIIYIPWVKRVMMASFQEKWLQVDDHIKQRGIFMFNNDLLSDVSRVSGKPE